MEVRLGPCYLMSGSSLKEHRCRWMCGISLKDRRTNEELRRVVGVEPVTTFIRSGRLRWYGHMMRKGDEDWVKKCMEYRVEGRRPVGRPRKTWLESVEADMAERSRPTRGGTVRQQTTPANRDHYYPDSLLFVSAGFLPRVSSTIKPLRRRPDRTQLLLLLMAGDIHPNPGPTAKYPCPVPVTSPVGE